jgi:hypothetical protein
MNLFEKYQQQITQAATYPESIRRGRYVEIRNELDSTIQRQITVGAMKAIAAVACLFLMYTTRSNPHQPISSSSVTELPIIIPTHDNNGKKFILRALLLAGTAVLTYSCSTNYSNYKNLTILLAKLRRDYNF